MNMSIALLRGINVGGRNKLPMKELVILFEAAGCQAVRSYIQSGNVVFDPGASSASSVAVRVADDIEARFGFRSPVVVRYAHELAAVVTANPFLAAGAEAAALHVAFLAHEASPEAVSSLDPDRSPGDQFAVQGREIYLHCPNGLARTKLTNAYFDRQLATISTVRNWRTVSKLLAMSGAS